MNKKLSLLILAACLGACQSNRKIDYIITDSSSAKKPVWVENVRKFESKKENESEKYKYFRAESTSINKRLCEKSALDNTNIAIAGELDTEINDLYTGYTNVSGENTLLNDDKKEEIKVSIRNNLSGVEPRESYWEKRKYTEELGATEEKVVYHCYQLSRVDRKTHNKLISEAINRNLRKIKNSEEREKAKEVVKENAEKSNIDIEVK